MKQRIGIIPSVGIKIDAEKLAESQALAIRTLSFFTEDKLTTVVQIRCPNGQNIDIDITDNML